jgi:hypothetical protein
LETCIQISWKIYKKWINFQAHLVDQIESKGYKPSKQIYNKQQD